MAGEDSRKENGEACGDGNGWRVVAFGMGLLEILVMKKFGWVMALVMGVLAGCAMSGRGSGDAAAVGNVLVAETMPTSRPTGADLANVFTQEVFHYGSRAATQPSAVTAGWTERPLRFEVQHPYDLKLADRYGYDAGTDTLDLWVLGTDKAHLPPPNQTTARTELRLVDPEYKAGTGKHMMTCEMYIVPGTYAAITQVFATGPMAMVVVDPEGKVFDLRTHAVFGTGMAGKWFQWRVVHDTDVTGDGAIKVYVDNQLVGTMGARKSESYYFKVGVYSRHGSGRSEVKVRGLRVWVKG
jgi:hypothetical protein